MREERPGRRPPRALPGLALALLPLALLPPLTAQGAPQSGAAASRPLEDWDEKVRKLQQGIWSIYSQAAPLGKDMRGKTVSDDLAAWIMTAEVRTRLAQARAAAQQAQSTQGEARARALLEQAAGGLEEQSRTLALITTYWNAQPSLRRQRALLERWGAEAPALLPESEARIERAQQQLLQRFSRQMSAMELAWLIAGLEGAYDEERSKIAGVVSEQQAAAGHFTASRDRSLPCPPAAPAAGAHEEDHAANIASAPLFRDFYPRTTREDGISGTITLNLRISAQGCMEAGHVMRSSGSPALDEAALDIAEHSSFRPAVQKGKAVPSTLQMPFTFEAYGREPSQAPASAPSANRANPSNNTANSTTASSPANSPANSLTSADPDPKALRIQETLKAAQALINAADYAGAIRALNLTPEVDSAALRVARATAYSRSQQPEAARADIERALQLEPHNLAALRFKGFLDMGAGHYPEALAAFASVLQLAPQDRYALEVRVAVALRAGDLAQAVELGAAYAAAWPNDPTARTTHALVLRSQHRIAESAAQAAALAAVDPPQRDTLVAAANIYAASGKPNEALAAATRAMTLFPGEVTYLTHARLLPRRDRAGRLADIQAALKHVPDSVAGALALADEQTHAGDLTAALATLQQALPAHPGDLRLLVRRSITLRKSGQTEAAAADLREARSQAQTPQALNTFCWELAIADVELEQARAACQDATQKDPLSSPFQDSLGMVLMRLGDLRGALAAYDAALKIAPLNADSRYGRALVRQRLGDRTGAAQDLELARACQARIDDIFADYGLTAP